MLLVYLINSIFPKIISINECEFKSQFSLINLSSIVTHIYGRKHTRMNKNME